MYNIQAHGHEYGNIYDHNNTVHGVMTHQI